MNTLVCWMLEMQVRDGREADLLSRAQTPSGRPGVAAPPLRAPAPGLPRAAAPSVPRRAERRARPPAGDRPRARSARAGRGGPHGCWVVGQQILEEYETAEEGDAEATALLAWSFLRGRGVPADPEAAVLLAERAAAGRHLHPAASTWGRAGHSAPVTESPGEPAEAAPEGAPVSVQPPARGAA